LKIILYGFKPYIANELKSKIEEKNVSVIDKDYALFSRIDDDSIVCFCVDDLNQIKEAMVSEILIEYPNAKILALTQSSNFMEGKRLLELGVKGYGNSRMLDVHINDAIRFIGEGNVWLYPEFVQNVIQNDIRKFKNENYGASLEVLTPKEREVAELILKGLTNMFIEPSNNFTFTYRRRGIPSWDFSQVMPEELEGFVRDIDPAHAIRMINGSFIIGEYRKMDECTGLLLYYNELRDEYFAELRYKSYPEIDHHLDAKNLDDLAVLLREHLGAILKGLNERID